MFKTQEFWFGVKGLTINGIVLAAVEGAPNITTHLLVIEHMGKILVLFVTAGFTLYQWWRSYRKHNPRPNDYYDL